MFSSPPSRMLYRNTLFVLLVCATSWALKPLPKDGAVPLDEEGNDDESTWMLPANLTPETYDITLKTYIEKFDISNPDTFKFDGTANIFVIVDAETDTVVLHKSSDMEIKSVALVMEEEVNYELQQEYDNITAKLAIKVKKDGVENFTFKKGENFTLQFTYTGVHSDDMHGFYRSSYVNEQNETKWLVTTQFESYDARRAFPCFDEPKYKAKYSIKIDVHKDLVANGYSALSNMDLEKQEMNEAENTTTYVFKQSEKNISSYLVAFIVSDFTATNSTSFEETKKFVTYGRKRYIDAGEAELSQIVGPLAMTTMKKLTNVPFGYPKCDQIGIPDFSAGAMENWGLITYRERLIFFDKSKNPTTQRQSVVTTTTHELAHQWFGDLVTLHWWSDIWLNEGFATFFEYHATDEYNDTKLNTSSWKIINQMVAEELQAGAFVIDAQPNSRPLTKEVYKPGDIDANFDNVAYSKGGSVIRMWMHTLGKETFYKALNSYLSDNAEDVGTPESLLEHLEKAITDPTIPVKPMEDFKKWHTQAGYPVISVSTEGNTSTLTQERYLVSGNDADNLTWTIPITYTTNVSTDFDSTKPTQIFKDTDEKIVVLHDASDWIIFNIQQTGYYRVNYDATGWKSLAAALKKNPEDIHEINRAQILDDAFWLARSTNNYLTYDLALDLSLYLSAENELVPWRAALNSFSFLYDKLAGNNQTESQIKQHILSVLKDKFISLTLSVNDDDEHTQRILRGLLASMACKLDLKECVDNAQILFDSRGSEGTKETSPIHPDVKTTVYCSAIRQKGKDVWDLVWGLYESSIDNAEQTQYLSALGCSRDADILKSYLEKTLQIDSGIRKQDTTSVFSSVYSGNYGNVKVALKFLTDNYETIANVYGGLNPLGSLLSGIATKLGTEDDVKILTDLSTKITNSTNPLVNAASTSSKVALDIVNGNKAWNDIKLDSLKTWLNQTYPAGNSGDGAATTSVAVVALLLPFIISLIFTQ